MHFWIVLMAGMALAGAQVVPLTVEGGAAEIECISPVTFRLVRWWGPARANGAPIAHDKVKVDVEDRASGTVLTTRYLVIEIDKSDLRLRVKTIGGKAVLSEAASRVGRRVAIDFSMGPAEKFYGLGAEGGLDLRGERVVGRIPFLLAGGGYGRYFRGGVKPVFDLRRGRIELGDVDRFEYVFYYGPTPKEILEEHLTTVGQGDGLESSVLDVLAAEKLPREATPLPRSPLATWAALDGLVARLNQWSLSAVLYPALDLASLRETPAEVHARALELASLLPIVYNGRLDRASRERRERWKPYLITYLREARDRGYPLIRPLLMQFARDAETSKRADVFMLGDELLVAPVCAPGAKRVIDLPMGHWTDLRTNIEYAGRQRVEIEAPAGEAPLLVRNGSLVPLAARDRMELHYFPRLGGEFFLWEPELAENTQFHAAPAGELMRVEMESKVERVYEWVVHHTPAAREVIHEERRYTRVDEAGRMKPGTWWHDAARNDLHVMVRAEAGADRIVNVRF